MRMNALQTDALHTDSLQTDSPVKNSAHPRRSARASQGFTIVEMLIAAGILGVVLTFASMLLQSSQGAASTQQARTNSLEDGRAAMSRINETITRAAYIYPSGVTITTASGLIGKTTANQVTTGSQTLAVLLPDDLGNSPRTYYGVIFYLTDRSKTKFAGDLSTVPSTRLGESVVVEARTTQTGTGPISWNQNANPATAILSWPAVNEGVLADAVVAASSSLMFSAVMSPLAGYDDTVFAAGLRGSSPAMTASVARLLGVGYRLAVQIAPPGKTLANTTATILRGLGSGRAIPRR